MLSKQLAAVLTQKGYQVTLTRTDDRYVSLHDRTVLVNSIQPDLLVSVHINSSTSKRFSGIETFCLNHGLFEEKHGSEKNQKIAALYAQKRTNIYEKSNYAADCIHKNLITSARQTNPKVNDRHVQHKVPQVLYGVHVPSVLLELGFLSHEQEAHLLKSPVYQKQLVQGIAKGIDTFFATSTLL